MKVDTFFMDETEVTAAQYAQCVEAGVCQSQTSVLWYQRIVENSLGTKGDHARLRMENDSCNLFVKGREEHPMNCVDWYQANHFCAWAFKRLPTEAEWEYAARAGTKTAYNFGAAKLDDNALYFDNSAYDDPAKGHPQTGSGYRVVGSKKANPWGLHDMHGNVAEWVVDGYDAKWYEKFAGKTVKAKDAVNWPREIFPTVARGGHWDAPPEQCRSASRLASDKKWQHRDPQLPKSVWWYTDAFHVGFRLVRPLIEPSEEEKLKYWEPHTDDIKGVLERSDKELRALIEKK